MQICHTFISQILDTQLLIRIVSDQSQYMPSSSGSSPARGGKAEYHTELIAPQETAVVPGSIPEK